MKIVTMVPIARAISQVLFVLLSAIRGNFFAAKKNNYEKILMNIFGKPIANLVTYLSFSS